MADKGRSLNYYLDRFHTLEREKQPWLLHFQALAQIFLTREMDFTRMMIPGEFLQAYVYDNTGQFSAALCASIILSMMWPDAGRTFRVKPVKRLKGLAGVDEFFRYVTEDLHSVMDNPRAGLQVALMEWALDWVIFGTSGLATLDGPKDDPSLPVVYDGWSTKRMFIDEDIAGFVDTVYYKRPLTARQIMMEYGSGKYPGDSVSPIIKEEAENPNADPNEQEGTDVLVVIEPKEPEKGKAGVAAMRVRTVHIDLKHNHIMRESGYHEMPVAVSRLFKQMDEKYGRSFGMLALPDAQSLNALAEAVLVATEKQLDPPLGVLDDGRLGGGVVDTSAGALTVFNSAGKVNPNEKPIFPLFTVGEMQSSAALMERLGGLIKQAFQLDRLLDLTNSAHSAEMTAYETAVRDRIRGESLGSTFSRAEKEVFTPTIQRTFNMRYRQGAYGIINEGIAARIRMLWGKITGVKPMVVPPAVIAAAKEGLDVFEVEYISPAKRFQQQQKLQGMTTAVQTIGNVSEQIPSMKDNVHPDRTARHIWEFSGAPEECLRTDDELKAFREAQAKAAEEQAKLAQAEAITNMGAKAAQGKAALGGMAGSPIAP
ncbi:MAG: hypothetical protein KGJ13_02395 [Patescibacteria group bacterium]|nr:hypothetical protein [Patescibacteria group bacterium]